MTTTLIERLKSLADEGYKSFQTKLIPEISADSILGVRILLHNFMDTLCMTLYNAPIYRSSSAFVAE